MAANPRSSVYAVKVTAICGLVTSLMLTAPRAAAGEALEWKPEWPRFRTSEWIVATAAGAGLLGLYLLPPPEPTWGRPVLFDEPVRDAIRVESSTARDAWAQTSDLGYYGLMAYPLLVDALIVPLARGSKTVAAQTTLINLQAFAVSGFVFRVTEATVRRARPTTWDCKETGRTYASCQEDGGHLNTNSFVAGHVTIATTGAALMCTHHAYLHLYGGPWDAIACGLGIAAASTVAVGRLAADKHYATDVLGGMAVGALSGWLMPTLLHYGFDGKGAGARAAFRYAPVPTATATSVGLTWSAVL